MVREKDKALEAACSATLDAVRASLLWTERNAKLVGPARGGLEQALKRSLVEARRLLNAAQHPMSAAVFGPSQAGKSFLIGKFLTPSNHPSKAVFGTGINQETLDFLTQVNPQGGKETTGLVTRFSIRSVDTPLGYPVVLRLLREIDLVKILANSFIFDLSGVFEARDLLDPGRLRRLIEDLEGRVTGTAPTRLNSEDVLELRDYLEESLPSHPFGQPGEVAEAYWPAMEALLPYLSGDDRAQALSPLWGGLPEFTALFIELRQGLDQLGHAAVAYAPMEAIRDTAAGVLHVDRIYELAQSQGAGAQPVRLLTADGTAAVLRKSVITALTLELRVTLDSAPWPFMDHTDLLDFPGARSREGSTPERTLHRINTSDNEKPAREYCFLRGKVAVLFDNYVADLDLNAMMLCIPDSNLEIRKLPELVEGWVAKTHGASAQERAGKKVSLLFCMTKCDRLFNLPAGASLEQQVENRFRTNFADFIGWTREWTPGRAFDNTFMLRNPKAEEQPNIFVYHGAPADRAVREEQSQTADFSDRLLPAFRQALAASEIARTHLADLDAKVDALLALNDGGTSYLADTLARVCDPDLRFIQIATRLRQLGAKIWAMLASYHDDDNVLQRVQRRTERIKTAIQVMVRTVNPPHGHLLTELNADEGALRQAYFSFARREHPLTSPSSTMPVLPALHPEDFGIDLDALDIRPTTPEPAPPRESFGQVAIARWLDGLLHRMTDPVTASRLGLPPEHFKVFIDELESGARRLKLQERIDAHANRAIAYRQPLAPTAAVAALGAAIIINDFIADAGRSLMLTDPDPDLARQAAQAFTRPPSLKPGDLPTLPDDETTAAAQRRQYPTEWARAFIAFTQENALSARGTLVDPEQNERLRQILLALADVAKKGDANVTAL